MTYSDSNYGVFDDTINPQFTAPPYDPLCYTSPTQYVTRTAFWAAQFLKRPLPTSFVGKSEVRTALGSGALISGRLLDDSLGLYQVDNQDPTVVPIVQQTHASLNFSGRAARTAFPAGAARKMYFCVDHNWEYQMGGTTTISVDVLYYDLSFNGSTDKLSLVYDGQAGTTTHATTFTLGNTGKWKQAVWPVSDAYFGGRLLTINGSSFGDFYLTHPDSHDLWISEVVVSNISATTGTYYYLVGPNNSGNVQSTLTTKNLVSGGTMQASSRMSATGSYTPSGGSPTTNP